ncbi:MAG: Insertion sequence putative ATP-binding protein [Bacteroidota bacterium]
MNDIHEKIIKYCIQMHLTHFKENFETMAIEAASERISYEQYLLNLFEGEDLRRFEKRKIMQLKTAGFPELKYLSDLERGQLPIGAAEKLPLLERLDFIKTGQNIILSGNPGTGKTHLAIALGIEACIKDYKVFFTSISRLLTQIRECRSQRTLRAFEIKFEKYDLVICDEFGYMSFDKEGAELLFKHLSLRCGRKSTIITTNLSFDRWNEIFGETVLATAMVDRLVHKAYVINMIGESYRMKENKKAL